MNVKQIEKKEKNTVEMSITVSPEEFDKAVNEVYIRNRGKISVPGFRKGKATRKVIEGYYGKSVFYEDAAENLYQSAYEFGRDEEKLEVVGRPSVIDVKFEDDKSLTITYSLGIYPAVTLGTYKGLSAPKPAVEVTDEEVERAVEEIRQKNARIQSVDRPSQTGDIVNIDYIGYTDGKAFEGGSGDGFDLEIGTGTFIPGFEEQLTGLKRGEKKDVNVTFPQNYAPELAGKDAIFDVTVNEVKEKILPDLDDEFAMDVSEFDTYAEYFSSVREELLRNKEKDADEAFKSVIRERLIENIECEIPDAMIDEHANRMIGNFSYNLASQGMNIDQYAKLLGTDVDGLKEQIRPTAVKEIKADLAFEAIAKEEKFEISDERVEEEYKKVAGIYYNSDVDKAKSAISETEVRTGLSIEMAQELVFSTAVEEKAEAETDKEEADKE